VARQGSAPLQGIVWCGRKMDVQHHASREKRSATSICQLGHQQDGEDTICQSMAARPVEAVVVQAFLEAVSPVGVEVDEEPSMMTVTLKWARCWIVRCAHSCSMKPSRS
jgi:hypothetical protein